MNLSDFLKLWRVEKASAQLAQMPPNFYTEAHSLTQEKDPYQSKKSRGIYNDLVHMRQHKMLMGCLRELRGGDRPQNLLANEKAVYKRIFEELGSMRSGDVQFVDETVVEEQEDDAQAKLSDAEGGDLKGDIEAAEEQEAPQEEASVKPAEDSPEEPKEDPAAEPGKEGPEEKPEEKLPKEELKAEEPAPEEMPEGQEALEEPEPETGKSVEEEPKVEEGPKEQPEEGSPQAEKPKEEPKEVFKGGTENKARMRVRFVKSMPAFVGPDLQTLGPFEEDQVTELDAEIAEILLTNDAVELV